MDKVQAWELLNNHDYSPRLTMSGLYDLIIRAGYPEEVAHKASMQRGLDRLSAGEVM